MSATGDGDPLAAIRRRFPGWHFWKSSAGRWWASRTGVQREMPLHPPAEWAMTVDADNTTELRNVLSRQEQLDGGDPESG